MSALRWYARMWRDSFTEPDAFIRFATRLMLLCLHLAMLTALATLLGVYLRAIA